MSLPVPSVQIDASLQLPLYLAYLQPWRSLNRLHECLALLRCEYIGHQCHILHHKEIIYVGAVASFMASWYSCYLVRPAYHHRMSLGYILLETLLETTKIMEGTAYIPIHSTYHRSLDVDGLGFVWTYNICGASRSDCHNKINMLTKIYCLVLGSKMFLLDFDFWLRTCTSYRAPRAYKQFGRSQVCTIKLTELFLSIT